MANFNNAVMHVGRLTLLTVLMTAIAVATDPDAEELTAFRSDLWNMEYRTDKNKDDGEKERKDDLPTTDEPAVAAESPDTEKLLPVNDSTNDEVPPPGEIALPDLEKETPLAEWQVETGTAPRVVRFQAVPSAWELSQAGKFSRNAATESSNGPSATTFAVAIVACIVVTGALFSGRD